MTLGLFRPGAPATVAGTTIRPLQVCLGNVDCNGDGAVDGGDLALVGGNWMWTLPTPPPGGAIPEPAGLGLVGMALVAFRKRRSL